MPDKTRSDASGFWLRGYVQQLVGIATLFGFNLVLPLLLGLEEMARFWVAQALVAMLVGFGAGFDLMILRLSGAGQLSRRIAVRLALQKMAVLFLLVLLLLIFRRSVPQMSDAPWLTAIALLALLQGASAVLMNLLLAVRAAGLAVKISVVQALLYVGLPTALTFTSRPTGYLCLVGVSVSYLLVVILEFGSLVRQPFAPGEASPTAVGLLSLTLVAYFDVLRAWAVFYLAGYLLPLTTVGAARICFSIAFGFAAFVPASPSMAVVERDLRAAPALRSRVFDVTGTFSGLVGGATVLACFSYGFLLQRSNWSQFVAAAPLAGLASMTTALSRLAVSLRLPTMPETRLGAGLLATGVTATVVVFVVSLRVKGVILALPAATAFAAIAWLSPSVLRLCFRPLELGAWILTCLYCWLPAFGGQARHPIGALGVGLLIPAMVIASRGRKLRTSFAAWRAERSAV